MRNEFIRIPDAEVLAESDGALRCRVAGKEVLVPRTQLGLADGTVHKQGDRGSLIIRRALAEELGLTSALESG
jgi:hypothetical protein